MAVSQLNVRALLVGFLAGLTPLSDLWNTLLGIVGDDRAFCDDTAREVAEHAFHLIAEHQHGDWTADELASHIADLVRDAWVADDGAHAQRLATATQVTIMSSVAA